MFLKGYVLIYKLILIYPIFKRCTDCARVPIIQYLCELKNRCIQFKCNY